MPQQWRLDMYRLSCAGATPEQMQREFGLPAEEIALRVEAARLCFEKQCFLANLRAADNVRTSNDFSAVGPLPALPWRARS
jgi:hypothetical protein